MKLGRYHESPGSLSFFQSSSKVTPRKLGNSLSKNPELTNDSMKLPALSGSLNMRSSAISLGSERNTKNRLTIIASKLDDLSAQVHNARMDSNETFNHMKFLRHELLDKQLSQDCEDMKSQVQGLRKLVQITKASHEQRSSDLRDDYISLWNQTEEMKGLVFNLRMRMDKIEEVMGMNEA